MSVTVSDGTGQDIKELHIDVTDINEAPTFISNTFSISGNEGEVCLLSLPKLTVQARLFHRLSINVFICSSIVFTFSPYHYRLRFQLRNSMIINYVTSWFLFYLDV